MKKIVLIALTVLFSVKLFALDFSIKLLPGYEFATEKLFNDAGGFSVGLGVDVAPITLRERDKLYITGQFASTNFPTKDLDLSKYILSESNIGDKYDLIGVINHYGGESFGHYTAYCLNGGKWFEYNDDSVTYIKEDNVVSSQAYVLFYKRKNN